jgi:hypothetical protein
MDDQHPAYHAEAFSNCIYKTKYDAFINFMNIPDDFRLKITKESKKKEKKQVRYHKQNKSAPSHNPNNLHTKE